MTFEPNIEGVWTEMKVHIKSWTAVAVWKWLTNDDPDCGICRLPFDRCCPDCRLPGDDCPIGMTYKLGRVKG